MLALRIGRPFVIISLRYIIFMFAGPWCVASADYAGTNATGGAEESRGTSSQQKLTIFFKKRSTQSWSRRTIIYRHEKLAFIVLGPEGPKFTLSDLMLHVGAKIRIDRVFSRLGNVSILIDGPIWPRKSDAQNINCSTNRYKWFTVKLSA